MGFLATLGNLFSGGIFGSITGLIGSYFTNKNKLELTKMQFTHQENMVDKQIDLLKAKAQAGVQIAEEQTKGQQAVADIKARTITYQQASKQLFDKSYMQYLPKWVQSIIAFMFSQVDVMRAIVRPLLAIIYTAIFLYIALENYVNNPASFLASSVIILDFIFYIVATIISWYYADRSFAKHIDRFLVNPNIDTSWHEVPFDGSPVKQKSSSEPIKK